MHDARDVGDLTAIAEEPADRRGQINGIRGDATEEPLVLLIRGDLRRPEWALLSDANRAQRRRWARRDGADLRLFFFENDL